MRPPLCDVCDADVDPADPRSLVSCVRAANASELGDLPGHPAHQVWLCEVHRDQGALLALSRTAAEVVAALREHPEPQAAAPDDPGDVAIEPVSCTAQSFDAAMALLWGAFERLTHELGLGSESLEEAERRDWMPMDNVLPPESPYVDRRQRRISRSGVELTLDDERAHWSLDTLARASATLRLRTPTAEFSLSAHTGATADDRLVRELFVRGDAPLWLLDEFGAPRPR